MISLNILFANDDVMTQWVMADVLTEAGFTVFGACRGTQVVELLDGAPDFDLLLMELALNDTPPGIDVAHQWRRALPGRPIIYTGPHRDALREPLNDNESFLRAPFGAGLLLRAVDAALEDAFYRPALSARHRPSQHVH